MNIPELVGQWTGPSTDRTYIVPIFNKIILIENDDMVALRVEYGEDKLPIV